MTAVRAARDGDEAGMVAILNPLIHAGDSTALTTEVTSRDLCDWRSRHIGRNAWHVAEDDTGLLGFQWIEPHSGLPADTCDIATFVRTGLSGTGIGSALFSATEHAARGLGYRYIAAVIRADNTGGLAYYGSRGFEDWKTWDDAPVAPRIMKRFTL
ncbi:GNAT family N-acetyltransferase [Primorskyibacter marinus]|uniref:GNAT family N-acetyltransferase n=1 Tax=Primorskyibacter marinus TaxID=1977320 RepID=UPI000E2FF672|nr:GNAT family N-acetyltransferase [Primorskyibacter marinus]